MLRPLLAFSFIASLYCTEKSKVAPLSPKDAVVIIDHSHNNHYETSHPTPQALLNSRNTGTQSVILNIQSNKGKPFSCYEKIPYKGTICGVLSLLSLSMVGLSLSYYR